MFFRSAGVIVAVALLTGAIVAAQTTTEPSINWIRPGGAADSLPLWGIRGGMAIGLSPLPGPRGLIRVYTPYLDQPARRVMNFIAVEPVVHGVRDLSELQKSRVGGLAGLRMWSADEIDLSDPPGPTGVPSRGIVGRDAVGQTLAVYICVEPYKNGAHCVIKIGFRSDRPHEVSLSTLAAGDSRAMQACVLTATMGNWARLRHLRLRDRTIDAADLFRGLPVNSWGFFDWHSWAAKELSINGSEIVVSATGDFDATTPAEVPKGWRYIGRPAVQSWTIEVSPGIEARVNGRDTFWATHEAVPGGAAFENFELYSPFRQGQVFRFGVDKQDSR